ncbi:MAG: recombinase RecA [Acidobacteria bacterium]|nr:recombinase RecA [Acidobacteriota bacterium]
MKTDKLPPARAAERPSSAPTYGLKPPLNPELRAQALHHVVAAIGKTFGIGTVVRLGDRESIVALDVIPTGSLSVDRALGIGGFPRGRITEIFGPESSGKTTLALHAAAQAQRQGGNAAFIDVEHALDANYARNLGVDTDNLLISQPDYAEQALEVASALISSHAIDVLILDSVAALVPKAELEGEMGDNFVGAHARLMSQAMRKLTGIAAKTNTCLIFINQIREKIGVMFGSPETTTGGRALKFYSSVRCDIRRIGSIKDGEAAIGNRTKVKIVKNKCAAPFREAEFDVLFGEGISFEGDLIDLGADQGLLEKAGSWFSYAGQRIGQGRDNARLFLRDNPDLRDQLHDQLREKLGLKRVDEAVRTRCEEWKAASGL